jgi:tol-pal system protein YbgF
MFARLVGAPYDRGAVRIAFALLLSVGCASPMTALKEDNRRLSQTVSELRAERRAQERRLRDLQRQLDLARAQLVMSSVDGAVPELRVEVAAPGPASAPPLATASAVPPAPATAAAPAAPTGASRVVGVADDGSEIVYEGDAATGKQATLDDDPSLAPRPRARPRASGAAPAEPARTAPGRASRAPGAPAREREPAGDRDRGGEAGNAYRAAVSLVQSGDHAGGAAALRAFLAKHPRHDFADNAQYWLGEAHYAQKDYPSALAEFRTVIETYPRGNKVPDALLKVGYCYLALGQPDKARPVLEQVVNLYPKTEPAATAAKRLESL